MTEQTSSCGGDRRKATPPSMQKTIFMSVAAALVVATVTNGVAFLTTMTRMQVVIESMDKRVATLELYRREAEDTHKKIEVELAKTAAILQRIQTDMSDIKSDMRALTYKPSVQRNIPLGE